jgi:hypothetical protein
VASRSRERGPRFPIRRMARSPERGHSWINRVEQLPAAPGRPQSRPRAGMALGERPSLAKTESIPVRGRRALISSRARGLSTFSRRRYKLSPAATGVRGANRGRGPSARRTEFFLAECEEHAVLRDARGDRRLLGAAQRPEHRVFSLDIRDLTHVHVVSSFAFDERKRPH